MSFRFKQFNIEHDRCAMKVGTDGVLFGAWVDVVAETSGSKPRHATALDVGTGTGLIALMMAQRNPNLHIVGIDIDHDAVEQAKDNVAQSPWADRIEIVEGDFRAMASKYDIIVSNPPFYTEDTKCPDERRNAARHTSSLPIDVLMRHAETLLNADGRLALIVPTLLAGDVISEGANVGLYLSRRTDVRTTPRKQPKRTMLEFVRQMLPAEVNILDMRDTEGQLTDAYLALTSDFYL